MPDPIQPKKVLGQYFLKNTTAVMQSINALRLEAGETVIEIGPGTGALTLPLLKTCQRIGCNYVGIEKDEELAQLLRERIMNYEVRIKEGAAQIIDGDILQLLPTLTHTSKFILPSRYKIIGNIPYYITGHLLRVISELPKKPLATVLMIQKEVAERVCAQPPKMNLLAAATQVWAIPKLLLTLKPSDFEPRPAVYSAVIELKTKDLGLSTSELTNYFASLHRIFKQPRKMLINNLVDGGLSRPDALSLIEKIGLPATARPQDLTVAQCLEIAPRFP